MLQPLRVAIRTEASVARGTGHVKRCISLASALQSLGAEVCFVASGEFPIVASLMQRNAWRWVWLDDTRTPRSTDDAQASVGKAHWTEVDWWVVDHYGLDADWHDTIRRGGSARVLAIDDLANRQMSADLVVNGNPINDFIPLYEGLLGTETRLLGGAQYALLHPSYAEARRHRVTEEVRSIGIFMGGTDPRNACLAALRACRDVSKFQGQVSIVCSPHSPGYGPLQMACQEDPLTRLHASLTDLRSFFAEHDLQIGSGGVAALERCCIGSPSVAILIAANQLATLHGLQGQGAVEWVNAGDSNLTDMAQDGGLIEALGQAVNKLTSEPGGAAARRTLAASAQRLVDGRGAERVAISMFSEIPRFMQARAATAQDAGLLLEWANEADVRRHAFSQRAIEVEEHQHWLTAQLQNPLTNRLWVIEIAGTSVAQVRFTSNVSGWELSYSVARAFRGLGFGRKSIELAMTAMQTAGVQCETVYARVKLDNGASIRIFQRLGFAQRDVDDTRGPHLLFTKHVT